jgi:hypothetical protein
MNRVDQILKMLCDFFNADWRVNSDPFGAYKRILAFYPCKLERKFTFVGGGEKMKAMPHTRNAVEFSTEDSSNVSKPDNVHIKLQKEANNYMCSLCKFMQEKMEKSDTEAEQCGVPVLHGANAQNAKESATGTGVSEEEGGEKKKAMPHTRNAVEFSTEASSNVSKPDNVHIKLQKEANNYMCSLCKSMQEKMEKSDTEAEQCVVPVLHGANAQNAKESATGTGVSEEEGTWAKSVTDAITELLEGKTREEEQADRAKVKE